MYKRLLEAEFLAWMKREEILILTGSRQVGKSTFLKDIQSRMSETTVFYNLEDLDLLNLFDENPKNLPKLLRENFPK
jgi:predicted AAA+ superfamily ATPase